MRYDWKIEGAKNGMQTSFLRGDLDLCKTCFDILSEDAKTKVWLKWSLPMFAADHACYLLSEYNPQTDTDYLKFALKLCLAPKQRDAFALAILEPGKTEIPPSNNAYVQKAIDYLQKRLEMGGSASGKEIIPYAARILSKRPYTQAQVNEHIQNSIEWWSKKVGGKRKPFLVAMPWYVFGPETDVGKKAFQVLLDNMPEHGESSEAIKTLWYLKEMLAIHRYLYHSKENPNIFEHHHYDKLLEQLLPCTKEESREIWKEVQPQLQGCIEWVIKKEAKSV